MLVLRPTQCFTAEYYGLAYDNCVNGSMKYNAINVINTTRLHRNGMISLGEYPIRSVPCIGIENNTDRTNGFHPTVCTNNLTGKVKSNFRFYSQTNAPYPRTHDLLTRAHTQQSCTRLTFGRIT